MKQYRLYFLLNVDHCSMTLFKLPFTYQHVWNYTAPHWLSRVYLTTLLSNVTHTSLLTHCTFASLSTAGLALTNWSSAFLSQWTRYKMNAAEKMWDKLVCIQLYHTVNKRMYINQSCHCNGSTMQVLLGCLSTTIHKMPLKSYGVEMLAHGSETAHPLLVNPSLLTHHKWHCCTMAIAIQLLEDTSKFSPTGRNLQCNKINVQYYYNKPSSSMYHKSAHFKPFLQWA